jgi:hypothetical protein
MSVRKIVSTMAVVGASLIAASAASAATVQTAASTSSNWSGYAVQAPQGATPMQFSNVSGSWVQPSVNCSAGQADAAFWVGIGGASQASNALEQVGTEADCGSDGKPSAFAWYELVPSAPVQLNLPINTGDHMTGRVAVSGSAVTVSLADQTSGQSVTKTLQMQNPDLSSAEWIAEAPSTCDGSGNCQPLPLADFTKVAFDSATATANGHTGTISDPAWTAQAMQLDGSGNLASFGGSAAAGAAPSTLSSDGSSFTVATVSAAGQASGSAGATGSGQSDPNGATTGYWDGSYGYGGYGYGNYGYGGYGYGS